MAKTEQGSSKMDTVLKMLLIAFVSLLAFSSGVYFGKQMSDSDHQLKALESDFNTQSTLTAENGEGAGKGEEQVGDEEVAALSDKYVNAEKEGAKRDVASANEHGTPAKAAGHEEKTTAKPAAHGAAVHAEEAPVEENAHSKKAPAHGAAPAHDAAPAHEEKVPDHSASVSPASPASPDLSAAHRAAERVANNASPVANVAAKHVVESRVPTSLPKTVGTNGSVEFTVQVASYPTADAAKTYSNDLVKKGFPAFPVEATINGRTWYRVSVGSFKTMKDASTYRAQLLKQADLQNAIVQKITR